MPTFRFHRGSLHESMKTCHVVHDLAELALFISSWNDLCQRPSQPDDRFRIVNPVNAGDIKIIPYGFDERIGWNTHLVVIKSGCVTRDDWPVGMLSDHLD